jgi:hypothetical protein
MKTIEKKLSDCTNREALYAFPTKKGISVIIVHERCLCYYHLLLDGCFDSMKIEFNMN